MRARATKADDAAIPFFQQAIEKDPNFALAHAKLSVVLSNLGRQPEAKAEAEKAYELRDTVSEYERLYILWSYYARTGDDAKTKETLEVLTTTYPRDFAAKNNYGIYLSGKGKIEEALAQYLAAHEIAPSEPQPAINAASALFNLGRYDEAMKMADLVMSLRPDRGIGDAPLDTGASAERSAGGEASRGRGEVRAARERSARSRWCWRSGTAGSRTTWPRNARWSSSCARTSARKVSRPPSPTTPQHGLVRVGGAALDSLKKAVAAPGAARPFVRQAAVVTGRRRRPERLRRELPRLERDEHLAPGAAPPPGLVIARA